MTLMTQVSVAAVAWPMDGSVVCIVPVRPIHNINTFCSFSSLYVQKESSLLDSFSLVNFIEGCCELRYRGKKSFRIKKLKAVVDISFYDIR